MPSVINLNRNLWASRQIGLEESGGLLFLHLEMDSWDMECCCCAVQSRQQRTRTFERIAAGLAMHIMQSLSNENGARLLRDMYLQRVLVREGYMHSGNLADR